MESITNVEHAPDIKGLRGLFPEIEKEMIKAFNRPHGNVDMLLGMASRSLHYKNGHRTGELRLNKSVFAPEWVMTRRA